MRIAQVAPLFESVPPVLYGGTERVVSWLTEELVRLGHDVTLFASGDSVTNARLVPVCPRALRLDAQCHDPVAHHVIMTEHVFREAANFDLIHFHIDYIHFPLSRRSEVPCLTTQHGRLDIPDLVPIFQTFREMPLVSISDAQRTPLPWANWQGTVLHGMPRRLLKRKNGDGNYLAFLGRASPEKGLDEAIEIACRAGMQLKIAAKVDHADTEYFENQIKPLLNKGRIDFIGEIGHDEKNDFLGNAAALLFPIQWPEPFGIVMIEALACGTPVIAYRRGSVPEVIEDGVTGFIVDDVDGAVSALENLEQIDRRACRKYFERHFSDERMAAEYLAIYKKLVQKEPTTITLDDGVMSWTDLLPNTTT
ncbi:MAG: glycosyltransferase family 4 protein [Candidatus Sulfotelmatobacter sp.]|jgi:glycosyltransferase involved in cell wall biosynthesis